MGNFYRTNAIYEALKQNPHNFQWVSGNSWLLVYGNKIDVEAKLLVLAHGNSWEEQENIINTLKLLENKIKIPIFRVVFDDTESASIKNVYFSKSLHSAQELLSLDGLKMEFKHAGLDITEGACDKYLNDKISSAYHKWQRESLGNKIIVSDLDLIRVNAEKEPIEFIELKRSTASVSAWRPYQDDFANFNLIDSISQQTKIPLSIVYNRMVKGRVRKVVLEDIYSRVSIFSFSKNNYRIVATDYGFDDFVAGGYLKNGDLSKVNQSGRPKQKRSVYSLDVDL